MLEKLALKHSTWVKMAKGICKDSYLADDLVSEMYLKFANYDKELNDYYIYYAIKHIYIDWLRQEKKLKFVDLLDNLMIVEESIQEEKEIPDCITWVEKQILLLRQELSGREIEKQFKINYQKVHRIENKAKEKINLWLEEEKLKDLAM